MERTLLKMVKGKNKKSKQKKASTSLECKNWTCIGCNKAFTDPDDQVMECDRCRDHFCINCLIMPQQIYEFVKEPSALWCSCKCSIAVKTLIKNEKNDKPRSEETDQIRKDLDTTINCVKTLMKDFHCFVNGPNRTQKANDWAKTEDIPVKPLKDIILEANAEQVREKKEEERRKKNFIIHRAAEQSTGNEEDRKEGDKKLVRSFLEELELSYDVVEKTTRLAKKTDTSQEKDTPLTEHHRPLMVTLNNSSEVETVMKNLRKLKNAPDELRNLRISPDRSMKEREEVRNLIQRAKNLTEQVTGDFMHIVRGTTIIKVKKRTQ